MIQHVADDLYQISEQVSGSYGQEAINVYALLNDDRPILIDCGSQLHRQPIMADLDQVLAGRVPEYIFLTHSELPHAGNISAVVQKWPQIKVMVSNVMLPYIEVLPVLPLEQMIQVVPGTRLEFPGRTLEFVDALLKDQPGSQWIYDYRTRALFTGDGFGYYHSAEMAHKFSDEIPGGIQEAQFREYHRTAFRFLRWVQPHRFNADLERLFQRRPVEIIAPIHGCAIRGDIERHLERVKAAINDICSEYRVN
jgi:flavorubredoxin